MGMWVDGTYETKHTVYAYGSLRILNHLFLSGYLVDKFKSTKLLYFINIPLLISMIILFKFNLPISSFFIFGIIGVTNGLCNVLGSSTWAEIYGVKYIGSIKALTTGLMVFSTAFGTALFGYLIDLGFSIEQIAFISGSYIFISLILLLLIRKELKPKYI